MFENTTPDFIPPIMHGLPGLYVDNVILFICVIILILLKADIVYMLPPN